MPLTPLLFLSPRVPAPLNTGAKIRTRELLQALAARYEIHYAGFLQPDLTREEAVAALPPCASLLLRPEPATGLAGKLLLGARTLGGEIPATIAKYRHRAIASHVARWDREHAGGIIHADHLHMGQYITGAGQALRAIDEHNVESRIFERLAARDRHRPLGWWFQLQAERLARLEAALAAAADMVFAVSEGDAADLAGMAAGVAPVVIRNGVDLAYFTADPKRAPRPGRLVFTGSMDWLPNQDAVLWFAAEVLPLLDQQPPRSGAWEFDIVGHKPPAAVRGLAGPRLRVTGSVPDTRPSIREAEIFVVPIRIGGGSRLKILEAFAMGIPVVSTTVGCEGLDVEDGHQLLIADGPQAFADAVVRLAAQPRLRAALVAEAAVHVRAHFSWEAIGRHLVARYEEALAGRRPAAPAGRS